MRAFLNAIGETRRHDHGDLSACTACAQRLREAVARYEGKLLAGFSLDSAPFEEWLVVRREALHRTDVAYCQLELGRLALAAGAYEKAAGELQQSLVLLEEVSWRLLEQEASAALAYVARAKGQHARARGHLRAALRPTLRSGSLHAALQSVPARALLLADGGRRYASAMERAVELYALVLCFPYSANARWFEDVAGKQIQAFAETLPTDAVAAAQERDRARDMEATVVELLQQLEEPSST